MIKIPTKKIPKGFYCYDYDTDGHMVMCPYWRNRKDVDDKEVNTQNYGYCLYLGKGDLEMNAEDKWINDNGEVFTADKVDLPLSLLWDMCKMCDINIDDE